MIAGIAGTVESVHEKFMIIGVQGVSYKVFVPRTLLDRTQPGDALRLFTLLYLRETTQELYGFDSRDELEFFELVLTVPSVGPATALAVLSSAPLKTIVGAIVKGDSKFLSEVHGVGRKTSEKIILELKDKLLKTGFAQGAHGSHFESDAVEALVALGYTSSQARHALSQVPEDVDDVEQKIKEALKVLGKK